MTLLCTIARPRTFTLAALAATALLAACDGNDPVDAGGDDAGDMDAGIPGPMDGAMFPDGTVFCTDESECDDGVDCTRDSCGPTGTCRNLVDPPSCDDEIFCNGIEQCDPVEGCVPGERETCNDENVCTIDRCNEETKSCDRSPRDQDEDGDADFFCEGGTDCNDGDPSVSGLVNEVCTDLVDNDCDEMVDETECGRPRYDTCDDPLDISAGGFFVLDTDGASPDYTLSCRGTTRDLVTQFTLTSRQSVNIEADGEFFTVALSLRTECMTRDSEIVCESGFPGVVRRRVLEPGTYYVIIAASSTGEIGVTATFGPPIEPATNDLCETPIDVSAGGRFMGSTVETADETMTSCGFSGAPDLYYTFTTTTEQNVTISALSTTGDSMTWQLANSCAAITPGLRCAYAAPATGTFYRLPAGTYVLLVEGPSFADVDYTLDVSFAPPTAPPPGDTCAAPIVLPIDGTRVVGTLLDKQDDHDVSCGFRYRDAVYQFTLTVASDVTVVMDGGAFANISTRPTCTDSLTQIRCTSGAPARQRIRNLAPGTYYVIAESSSATGFGISVEASTPPTVPTDVTGNENCMSAHVVPAGGGLFHGNTTTMLADLTTRLCGASATSNDAVFQLEVATRSRVVASTEGSSFDTVLHLHQTMCTSAGELFCDDDGGEGSTSLIDQMLDPGTYFIVVDGFGGTSAGEYFLEVMVTP